MRRYVTAYYSTIKETPHYLMFGHVPTLPIDVIMGWPSADVATTAQEYTQNTVDIYVLRMSLQGKFLAKEPRPKQRLTKQSNSMSSKKNAI